MRPACKLAVVALALSCGSLLSPDSAAANLLVNGNMDQTYLQEIVPGFFLPKPLNWVNEGFRTITGPFEDELGSEPWAGPAPTPVTTDGDGGQDFGAFFKPFSGGGFNGPATGHLYQDVPAAVGTIYTLTGWAGAEINALLGGAEIALEFLDAGNNVIPMSGQVINLLPTLYVDNGEPFDYKEYTAIAMAPPGTVAARARVSMIDASANPLGGGQAFVADDFTLVPEPTCGLLLLGALAALRRRRPA